MHATDLSILKNTPIVEEIERRRMHSQMEKSVSACTDSIIIQEFRFGTEEPLRLS